MSGRHPNRRHVNIDLGPERVRRRNLNRVALSIAVIFALIIIATQFLPGLVSPTKDGVAPTATADTTVNPVEGALLVEVVRIIDGDTLEVRSAQTELTVRLYGVDTPERGEACFEEAAERLTELAGDRVQLLPDDRLQDRFGRELRYVYTTSGELIDLELVVDGLGVAWAEDGQFRDRIVDAEEAARSAERGCLWAR